MFGIIRRRFASTIHELGAQIETKSIELTASKSFHELKRLPDFEAVKQAPEGSVVVVTDSEVPTDYQKNKKLIAESVEIIKRLESRFETSEAENKARFKIVEAENSSLKASVEAVKTENTTLKASVEAVKTENSSLKTRVGTLEEDVKELKVIPSAMQICETVLYYQQVLIKQYLPLAYVVLPKKDVKFNFLKGKSSSSPEIEEFFKQPIVMELDKFISTKEFRKVKEFRNSKAHEAVFDTKLLMDNFEDVSAYFKSISKNFSSASFNFDNLRGIHQHVQEIET